jgi:hypothetical protein
MKDLILQKIDLQTSDDTFRDYCRKIAQDEILQEISSRIRTLTREIVEGKPLKELANLHFDLQKDIENGAARKAIEQHGKDRDKERSGDNVVEITARASNRGRSGKRRR